MSDMHTVHGMSSPALVRTHLQQDHPDFPQNIVATTDKPKEICIFLLKNVVSYRNMRFPAEKCFFSAEKGAFLQKNAVWGWGPHGRKPQEIAEGVQAQEKERQPTFAREVSLLMSSMSATSTSEILYVGALVDNA